MFDLFKKKKYKNINEYPDTWSVIRSEHEGHFISIRFRDGLKEAVGHSDYPYMLAVMVAIKNPDKNGQPSAEEDKKLASIEEYLIKLLTEKDEAVFAFTTTVVGQRQYFFYTKNGEVEYMKDKGSSIEKAFTEYEFEFQNGKDPKWINLKTFFK